MLFAALITSLPMAVSLDGTVIGAFLGFLGITVTALCGVYVATRTNRSEKEGAALKALEETRDEVYEQRLTLKDEQVASAKEELAKCKLTVADLEARSARKDDQIERLQQELALERRRGIDSE